MNFPGPIKSNLSSVSAVSLDSDHFSFAPHQQTASGPDGANGIIIPDKHLLFTGDYAREGNDLILSAPDQKYVVHDYFKGEKRPALISEDGAMLSGHIVSSLTGYVQYAQATPSDASAQVVGHVMKLTGSASVIRNGVTVELNIGDAVQKGDVVQTGSDSSIAMTLVDGSAFGMTSNARMVLNEMVYDPNGSSNSSFISLVQGTVTFVAGQTAKNGNMRVETPVATMGIRGTAVLTKINLVLGTVEVSLGVEPDQHVGGLVFYDNATGALIGTMTQAGRVTVFSPSGVGQPVTAAEYQKSPDQVLSDKSLFNQVFQLYFPNFNPDDSKPKSTDRPRTDIGVPPTVLGKNGTDPDTGRPTITYIISSTNPDTHVTTDLKIIYTNTPASFSVADVDDVQATTVLGAHQFKLGDRVTIIDPDIGVAPFFDVAIPYVTNSGTLHSSIGPASINFGSYLVDPSRISFNAVTGVVTYDPELFKFLDDGETAVYTFKFTAVSGPDAGAETLLLTVTGENDAPTIVTTLGATNDAGGVKEDAPFDANHNIATNGIITFRDFDLTDAHNVSSHFTSTSVTLPNSAPGTEIGHFTVDPVSENLTDTSDTGTVAWKFELNYQDPILQSLAEGQTIAQTYTVTITDNNGVPVDQIVTITITGTNDAPLLTADTSSSLNPHIADEALDTTNAPPTTVDTVQGSLTFSDVDLTDTHQASAALDTAPTSVVWSGGLRADIPQATLDALATAMTASISTGVASGAPGVTDPDSTDTGFGSLDWKFSLPDHLSDFLAHGETLTVVYDVTVTDYNNGVPTGTSSVQQVTVQISAANDQPTITVIDTSAAVTEDLNPQAGNLLQDTGSVAFADTDTTDTHTINVVFNADAAGTHGAVVTTALNNALATALTVPSTPLAAGINSFDWSFALDNSLAQYLGVGETVTASYTIEVLDNSGVLSSNTSLPQVVTVTITGTNDAPSLTAGVTLPSAAEDTGGTPQTLASLFAGNVQDVDQTFYLKGFAISDSGVSTDGAWWFSDNGGVWSPIGSVSQGAALIVDASVLVKFLPNTDFNGDPPSLTVYAIDDSYIGNFSSGSGGTRYTVDLTQAYTHGDTAPISQDGVTISTTITPVNDAPVATGTATLAAIDEDTLAPAGDTVGNLFASNFSDARDDIVGGSSSDNFAGIAITGYNQDSAKGDWEYSIDNGSSWIVLGNASFSATVLLGSSDLLRFVPAHDYDGAATALSANLIESGEVFAGGDTIVLSAVGGTTHFSLDQVTLGETINPVNDAPVLDLNSSDAPNVSTGYSAPLLNDGNAFPIASSPTVTDVDNTTMTSATVVLTDGQTNDFFFVPLESFPGSNAGTLGSGITWTISGTAGDSLHPLTVTFSGAFSSADYEFAIQQVSFGTTSGVTGARHIEVTVNDGQDNSGVATATINVQGSGGNIAPVANDDAIYMAAVSNLFATSGNLTGNDSDPGDTFTISSGTYVGNTNTPDIDGIIRLAGSFGTLLLFSTNHAASSTLGSLTVPGAFAGDYVFVIGYDINGNQIYPSPIDTLLPGDAPLTDQFQYTVIDSFGLQSNTANINVTYDLNPIVETVQTSAGYDAASLWTDLNSGILGTYDANHITLVNGSHTVNVDATGLTWNTIPGGIELTGGVINAVHVTDSTTSDPLLDLTNLNTHATDFYAAVGPSGSQPAFDALFDTRAFDIHGGAGADNLTGYNFNDRIDTGGGADVVHAGDGNDLIIVHDNSAWQIDGGNGMDTLRLSGGFDLLDPPANQSLNGIEILDLNKTDANAVNVVADGVKQIADFNDTGDLTIFGDGQDTVILNPLYAGDNGGTHPNGHWSLMGSNLTYSDPFYSGRTFDLYSFMDGTAVASLFVEQGITVRSDVLSADQITTDEAMNGVTTVFDAYLNDVDQNAYYTVSAVAQHGSVTTVDYGGLALDDPLNPVTAQVSVINAAFHNGIVYTPDTPSGGGELYDTVTLTVHDTVNSIDDTINFVFRQQGNGAATLVGTNEKDMIFGTENGDTLTGLGGSDNFVFTNTFVGSGNDTVTDFRVGADHIMLNNFGDVFNNDFANWLDTNVADSVNGAIITIDGQSSVTLNGITKAALHANDFIVHPGTLPGGM